jgi:ABC-2 type transport system ATP-binding protein
MQASADSDIFLSLRGLRKSYGDVVAVRDLSMDVRRGEILGFLGPNGAGKTTTMHMICGLLRSDAGAVFIGGQSLDHNCRVCKRMIGLCPQELVIWESLTCLEQLEFVGRQYDMDRNSAWKRAEELLEALGLTHERSRLAGTLSGGMKRRLNIALALVHEPQILILDEPQAGLDPQSRVLVRDYVKSLRRHTTVVLTTHDMDEADRLSDRVAIIDHGSLLELDTPEGLKSRIGAGDVLGIRLSNGQEEKLERLLGDLPESLRSLVCQNGTLRLVASDTMENLPAVFSELRRGGLEVEDVSIRKKTLEDVFIALTGRRLRD